MRQARVRAAGHARRSALRPPEWAGLRPARQLSQRCGRRLRAMRVRMRGGAGSAGSPCGPRRGGRGRRLRGWCGWRGCGRGPIPPSSPLAGSVVWRTAQRTIKNSATTGIFSRNISQMNVHASTRADGIPARRPLQALRRRRPLGCGRGRVFHLPCDSRRIHAGDTAAIAAQKRTPSSRRRAASPTTAQATLLNCVIACSSAARASISERVSCSTRSVPNCSTLNEASTVACAIARRSS